MAPPDDGNERLPFAQLAQLERVDKDTFRSIALPFTPRGRDGTKGVAYGGHVYMQAAWAACQTVDDGFLLHNVSGNFLSPGIPTIKFTYHVLTIRNGRTACTRIVNVSQREGKGYMFSCICSFKTVEAESLDVQAGIDIWEKYKSSLEGLKVKDMPEAPGYDVPWYSRDGKENDVFPGLYTRQADLTRCNEGKYPLDKRQLVFYRTIGNLDDDEPNMHLVAQIYASDRNSLFHVCNAVGLGEEYSVMGSLVHQVIFHTGIEDLKFGRDEGDEKSDWFVKEGSVTRYVSGRGLFCSRVWNSKGRHVMTVTQDGMVRIQPGTKIKEIENSWKGSLLQELADVNRRQEKL